MALFRAIYIYIDRFYISCTDGQQRITIIYFVRVYEPNSFVFTRKCLCGEYQIVIWRRRRAPPIDDAYIYNYGVAMHTYVMIAQLILLLSLDKYIVWLE